MRFRHKHDSALNGINTLFIFIWCGILICYLPKDFTFNMTNIYQRIDGLYVFVTNINISDLLSKVPLLSFLSDMRAETLCLMMLILRVIVLNLATRFKY